MTGAEAAFANISSDTDVEVHKEVFRKQFQNFTFKVSFFQYTFCI